ncbi:MAG TPA: hypothetical protein DDY68_03935 [Porphyromonadaceae bacterium]|nr:hypothetical protein [Porphyromonadaceae bacterium]
MKKKEFILKTSLWRGLLSLLFLLSVVGNAWGEIYEWSHDNQKGSLSVTAKKAKGTAGEYSGYSISYGDITYTKAVKMESATTLTFTTTKSATITVGVALNNGTTYSDASETALKLTTKVEGMEDVDTTCNTGITSSMTGATIEEGLPVVFKSVGAGTQVITRAGSEEGVFYIKVEEDETEGIATPTITIDRKAYNRAEVTIDCETEDAEIYYTTGGDTPTKGSTQYNSSFEINTTTILKAIAIKEEKSSDVAVATYKTGHIITYGTSAEGSVSVKDANKNTINTNDTVENNTSLTATATASAGYEFVKWTKGAGGDSITNVNHFNFTITQDTTLYANFKQTAPAVIEPPTFSPSGGVYSVAQNVSLSCATDGAKIYYTTGGGIPTKDSTQYTSAIAISTTTTLKAIAIKDNKSSDVAEATYTINQPEPPIVVISDGNGLEYSDAVSQVNSTLSSLNNGNTVDLKISRTIKKDGYYNTLCLPFDMTAEQIQQTFGVYKELKEFKSAMVVGSGSERKIVLNLSDATSIVAGKAYLISFENGEDLTSLNFSGVKVSMTSVPEGSWDVYFQGIFAPYKLESNANNVFVGEQNKLYWPTDDGTFVKGFRAYFKISSSPVVQQKGYVKGTRAVFGSDSEDVSSNAVNLNSSMSKKGIQKLIEKGQVVIVVDGKKHDINGNLIR